MNQLHTAYHFHQHGMDHHGMPMGMGMNHRMDHHNNHAGMVSDMEPYQVSLPGWMTASRSSKKSNSIHEEIPRIPYPRDFVPTVDHVICGRGKKSYGHCGNKNFLTIVAQRIDDYSGATTKQEKSDIVQSIVDALEAKGGFIRLDSQSGLYFRAEEGAGREKTSQALRDCLNHKYKSSKDIKRKNRKEKRLAKCKQSVHQQRAASPVVSSNSKTTTKKERRPSVVISTADKVESSCLPLLPPRTISSTSVDMAAAAAVVQGHPMPISPAPLLVNWNAHIANKNNAVHLIQGELEPLPFRSEEVERLAEMPLEFLL